MGYYTAEGEWMEGEAPPAPRAMPRQMRPAEERQADPNTGVRQQARRQLRAGYYDENGMYVEGVPANAEETAEDVRRSGVTGMQRGVSGIVGQFGDIPDLVEMGATALGGVFGVPAEDISGSVDVIRSGIETVFPQARGPNPTTRWPTSAEVSETIIDNAPESARDWLDHEPETTAGEYARTLGEFAPAVAAPIRGATRAGAGALERTLTTVAPVTRTARVAAPAIASEAAGQMTEGTEYEAPARLITALVSGGVNETFLNVLRRGGRTPDERALRLIQRELNDAGMSNDEITRQANRLLTQAPTEEVLAEVLGPGGLRLARAVANIGRGAGRTEATTVLDARAIGREGPIQSRDPNARGVTSIKDRVAAEAARTFSPDQPNSPNSYWDMLDTLRSSRAAQGRENYRNAYLENVDQDLVQQHLAPLMREAPDAARSGANQLDNEVQRLLGERSQLQLGGNVNPEALARLETDIADARAAAEQLRAIATGSTPTTNSINTRAIDYFQRGLQQAEQSAGRGSPEASALGEFRRGFNGLADRIAPGLGDTRAQYGRSKAIEEFTEMGRRVFNMSDGELERALRGPGGRPLSTEEFDGFQLGVLDAIENKLGQGDTGFLARLARNQNWRDSLVRATGGEANARRFMNRLAREANMQQTRNYVLRGSQTTPIAEDIAALTSGEQEFAFLSDNARQLIASGGQLRPLVTRWALGMFERFNRPGMRDPQVQEAMAKRLFSRVTRESSRELRDALNLALVDDNLPENVRAWLNRMMAVNSATDIEQPAEAVTP